LIGEGGIRLVFLDYGFGSISNHGLIHEKSKSIRWSYRAKRKSPSPTSEHMSLEDEIARLRKKMEQAFLENESLTAEIVVEISRLLDDKINEYMKKQQTNHEKN
jgi:hypothetical protein